MDPIPQISIHLIAAARPNFMKIAPLYHALKKEDWAEPVIVHTGQHYDVNMSDAFFQDLKLPEPHIHLGVGSGSHAEQTGKVMIAYEKVLLETRPDLVVVVGDVNSTMACTLATVKINYSNCEPSTVNCEPLTGNRQPSTVNREPSTVNCKRASRPFVAHLEAGLRSYDRTMPEEINRIVTDSLADILWTPSPDADENLKKEGIPMEKIIRVGNIMIDSLEMLRSRIESQETYKAIGLKSDSYVLATLHRPSNVDNSGKLKQLVEALMEISRQIPVAFPVHPRTKKNLENTGLQKRLEQASHVMVLEPLSYVSFMNLLFNCRLVITDSGGIQEETSYLGIPCLTIRPNTERPITISRGTNQLCEISDIVSKARKAIQNGKRQAPKIDLWDGKTAQRVVQSTKLTFGI